MPVSRQKRAYAAGLFDGEGCIQIRCRKRGRNAIEYVESVSVGSTDFEILYWLQEHFGGMVGRERKGVNRPIRYWVATNKIAIRFLKSLLPWLKIKREQARIVLEVSKTSRGVSRLGFDKVPDLRQYEKWEIARAQITVLKR